MNEKLLQYIWQFGYFNHENLVTEEGEKLTILHPGWLNYDQGPDFIETRIKIGRETWIGNTELHIQASDWNAHQHSRDKNYSNIILHVVWKNNKSIEDALVNHFRTIELQSRVPALLLERYARLMDATGFVPCEAQASSVKNITWFSWKERMLAERLINKSKVVNEYLKQSGNNWEEIFWWLLSRNMGMKVNAECFEAIARSLPVKVLAKHKNQLHQLEALLFGISGLLKEEFSESYPKMLFKEYKFLQRKYKLTGINIQPHFLRMRPGNFPTIRLAQLAMLIHNSAHLFSKIREAANVAELESLLKVTANDYWHYHYRFDVPTEFLPKRTGKAIRENIIINTIVPLVFAWGHWHNDKKIKDKSIKWLEDLRPENNNITRSWTGIGISNKNAFDSQALLELTKNYCRHKRCLDCSIGQSILKSK